MENMAIPEETVWAVIYFCDAFTQSCVMFAKGGFKNSYISAIIWYKNTNQIK